MHPTLCILALSALPATIGHGAMNIPASRNAGALPGETNPELNLAGCEGLACMWFSQGCTIGCNECVDTFNNFMNFSSACGLKQAPVTLPESMRSYNVNNTAPFPGIPTDWTVHHPWRSPGRAPVLDACGMSGGSTANNDPAGGVGNMTIAHRQGAFGSRTLAPVTWSNTTWVAGEKAEVSWGITANHGGGYSYRLCPADEELTEECFQRTPLDFVGETQRLRWDDGREVEIPALRTREGTTPEGSQWTRNPVPSCGSIGVGEFSKMACTPPQFPPPPGCDETCWGYQQHKPTDPKRPPGSKTVEIPAIVDEVRVPGGLKPGKWVVGWRWDCEQTPQVWASCGDVTVVAATRGGADEA